MLSLRTCLIAAYVVLLTAHAATAAGPNWQLMFRYNRNTLELVQADRIAPTPKQIRTPGLETAPVRVAYDLDWLDFDGSVLYSGPAELPLGTRSAFGADDACRYFMPDDGVVVVRVAGPDLKQIPRSLRLSQPAVRRRDAGALSLPAPFESDRWTFPVPLSSASLSTMDGPVTATKIRDTGPDDNRLVVVIMGDGYTAANLTAGQFETAAAGLGADIEAKPPWDVLFAATNIYRADILSNESGADNETYGVYVDTYLQASFWVNDIERLLALTGDGHYLAYSAANALVGSGVWDVILVLVNSTKYGGSGGALAVSSVHSSASEIVLHELGHSFANLADEYESPYPGFPAGDYEPNVDFDYDGPGLKWLAWVEPGTPLPTPEASPYLTTVGAFEGARYLSTGIYRPFYNCEMRSLNQQFCPVCREAHVREFTDIVTLLDDLSPSPGTPQTVGVAGRVFTAEPLPFDDLVYEWTLDDAPIEGETAPTLSLTRDMMAAWPQTLELTVTLYTDLVRLDTISQNYQWEVTPATGTCCSGIVGDANFDGAYEPTIADISVLIDHIFIDNPPLVCYEEGDVNQSGGTAPTTADITIGDISTLIDYLFISGDPIPFCL